MAMALLLAGALAECVHVAGILKFLGLAEEQGWETFFTGPATSVEAFVDAIRERQPDLVGVSYRLTPETGADHLSRFAAAVEEAGLAQGRRFCFGGTPPVAGRAREIPLFEAVFSGEEPVEQVIAYLRGEVLGQARTQVPPQTFLERWAWKQPRPLIRHHFGLPTVQDTVAGVRELAESSLLDVVSIGTDQDAQESFFQPQLQDPRRKGAGGVPVRTAEDLVALYQASRCGNYPLLRIYAGTRDLIRLAALFQETLHNAWAAIPLFWFNQMDGRGPMALEESIRVHQQAMAWHAERMGVGHYIAQYMFHSPAGLSHRMDLAKMLAARDLVETLRDPGFQIYHQTRTGLLSYPVQEDAARAQLATSVYLQMAMRPDVLHVVAFCEADHAANPADVISSVRMARYAVEQALAGQPTMGLDPRVEHRRRELGAEAQTLLAAIARLAPGGEEDALCDPGVLAQAVQRGLLDAPQLRANRFALGRSRTRIVAGACREVHLESGGVLDEEQRLSSLGF
jgi:hypothetical protein